MRAESRGRSPAMPMLASSAQAASLTSLSRCPAAGRPGRRGGAEGAGAARPRREGRPHAQEEGADRLHARAGPAGRLGKAQRGARSGAQRARLVLPGAVSDFVSLTHLACQAKILNCIIATGSSAKCSGMFRQHGLNHGACNHSMLLGRTDAFHAGTYVIVQQAA